MADVIPLKALYAVGGEPEAFAEVASGDTLRAPSGGVKFPDGTIQITAPGYPVEGPVGPQGPEGPIGETGLPGADSTVPGPTGPAGENGADGAIGPAGPAGTDGADGETGPAGSAGPEGPTVVSADAGNTAILGTDGFLYVPATSLAALEARVAELEAQMAALLPWTRL